MEQKQEHIKRELISQQDEKPIGLSVSDVAKILNISVPHTYALFKMEGFPKLQIGARMIIMKKDLLSWIDSNKGKMDV